MREPTKRTGHRVWIALQGYAVMACGAWIWITYDMPSLGAPLLLLGAGAHGWAREWVMNLTDRVPGLTRWIERRNGG